MGNKVEFLKALARGEVPEYTGDTPIEKALYDLCVKMRNGGGTGGGAPSDWNAAEGEPGHVLNRPFYSTYENALIVDDSMVSPEENMWSGVGNSCPGAGTTATVNWNGVEYLCKVIDAPLAGPGAVAIGNGYAMEPDFFENTGEPFVMVIMPLDGQTMALVLPLDGTTELNFSVSGLKETVVKIPEKYLPDTDTSAGVYTLDVTAEELIEGLENGVVERAENYDDFAQMLYDGGIFRIRCVSGETVSFMTCADFRYNSNTREFDVVLKDKAGDVAFEFTNGTWTLPT